MCTKSSESDKLVLLYGVDVLCVVFVVVVAKCDLFVYITGYFEHFCSNFLGWQALVVHGEYFLVVRGWITAARYYRAGKTHKNIRRKVGEYR